MTKPSLMLKEASETPQRVLEQHQDIEVFLRVVASIKQFNPKFVMIVGRGSSDHAGVFAKYLFEIELGIPTFAAAPSVASIYQRDLILDGGLVVVISQSGRSPDIINQIRQAKKSGAMILALVNDESSPLKDIVDHFIPLKAEKEQSVAATKSYLLTLSALLMLVACWSESTSLKAELKKLPDILSDAIESAPQLSPESLTGVKHLVVVGRGLGYAIAKEIALKLKEVCGIHAEAFSSAEFLHGPVTLVANKLTMINVAVNDESYKAHMEQIEEFKRRGATIIHLLQTTESLPKRLAPLALLQRFYIDIETVAQSIGRNPDEPEGLKKVTETL